MKKLLKKYIPAQLWSLLRQKYYKSKEDYYKLILNDYSQAGETIVIRNILNGRKTKKGFFVEIGANDGITVSSTFGLVKEGWSGLSVEANPNVFIRLERNLKEFPKVKTVCAAVALKNGPVKLFYGKNDPHGLLSTISNESSEWFEEHRSEEYIEVPGVPLNDLLEAQKAPLCPDLLIIDTEGMDYEILQSLDFHKYKPKLIVTEDYSPKNSKKFQLLELAGYSFVQQVGCNTFWLKTY
jgi:FkbM family methyltransferase